MTQTNVEAEVKAILAEVLGLEGPEAEQITSDAHLVDNLAAESIDFIDICFRLEKAFKIGKVLPENMFPRFLRELEMVDRQGQIKPERKGEALDRLAREYPHLQRGLIQELDRTNSARPTMSVSNIVAFVEHRLDQNGDVQAS